MPYLSRNDPEAVAKRVVNIFCAIRDTATDLCKIDIHQIAKRMLGLSIEHAKLSMDSSILGVTSYGSTSLFILDETNTATLYDLDGQTILIEKSLCAADQKGRYNFTLTHQISHQILKLLFPKSYGIRNRASKAILYRTKTLKKSPLDWEEWQADTLASCILMPPELIKKCLSGSGFKTEANCSTVFSRMMIM